MLNINDALKEAALPAAPAVPARSPAPSRPTRQELITEIQQAMASARANGARQGFHNLIGRSVSMTHMHVLAKLRTAGTLPMGRLAEGLDVSVASATGIVGRMEERGLVQRKRDNADRRVVLVELAEGGTAALEEIEARGREFFGRVLAELSKDELIQVRNGFAAMHRASQKLMHQDASREAAIKRAGKVQSA